MVTGNKIVIKIFVSLIGIMLLINMFYWVWPQMAKTVYPEDYQQILDSANTFHGFSWFLKKLGTFPGINPVIQQIQQWWGDLATLGNGALEWTDVLSALRIFLLPVRFLIGVIRVVLYNIGWLFSFLEIIII